MSETYRSRRRRDPDYRDTERGRVIPFQPQRAAAADRDGDERYPPVPRPLREEPGEWDEPPARAARPFRRRARSRVQRNAISIIGVCFLLGLLGLGYGLMQVFGQPGSATSATPAPATAATTGTVVDAAGVAATVPPATTVPDGPRTVQTSVQVLEPNYTVQAGDTLNAIASQFNTTAARIQALNDLADPRALKIGQKLVVPPPL